MAEQKEWMLYETHKRNVLTTNDDGTYITMVLYETHKRNVLTTNESLISKQMKLYETHKRKVDEARYYNL